MKVLASSAQQNSEPQNWQPSNTGSSIDSDFRSSFTALAAEPDAFHQFIQQVYGDALSAMNAERLRQQTLKGDFSWLPKVEYVGSQSLQGANGAYHSDSSTIFINEDIAGTDLARQTFIEEVGHHIDTLSGKSDTTGDEGEMFRRLLAGENLSATDLAAIRREDDSANIIVNGEVITVEFYYDEVPDE